jgi:hypothetical protein
MTVREDRKQVWQMSNIAPTGKHYPFTEEAIPCCLKASVRIVAIVHQELVERYCGRDPHIVADSAKQTEN